MKQSAVSKKALVMPHKLANESAHDLNNPFKTNSQTCIRAKNSGFVFYLY